MTGISDDIPTASLEQLIYVTKCALQPSIRLGLGYVDHTQQGFAQLSACHE